MKHIKQLLFLSLVALIASCGDPLSPGHEYMPDMYRSPSYETYGENANYADSMEAREPVKGTVPRGFLPYPYPNTAEGYEQAGLELKNPIPYSKKVVAEGKIVYDKMCTHCHGAAGKGDGKVANNPKYPGPPPAYDGPQLKDLPVGKMFHTITYGKGNMGGHASQITQEDRWKLVHYIEKLQGKSPTTIENETKN